MRARPRPASRREVLKGALAAGAALSLPASSWARVRGANEAVRIACVGVRGQGQGHMRSFASLPGVRVVALCDADSAVLGERSRFFVEKGEPITLYEDLRRLFDSRTVDAVSIATPNHWHALAAIWACQAGLDVYVEKPVSHNVWEGRKLVEAARKHGRVVQAGTQSRSIEGIRRAVEFARSGKLGKIRVARGLCYKPRASIGKLAGEAKLPESVDYELWCGPAPLEPLRRASLHYDWHWAWATGNGDIGNQGIHQMDVARWVLGEKGLSKRVVSIGGRFGYEDDGETPNTQIAVHEFDEGTLVFEVRGLDTEPYKGLKIGVVVECEQGWISIDTDKGVAFDASGAEVERFEGGGNPYANFVDAVRARDPKVLNGGILEGHLSSALCHTSNISYRVGRAAPREELEAAFKDQEIAAETLERFARHLVDRGIDLAAVKPVLGMPLAMDPATERFLGTNGSHGAANALLARKYRAPFVVPESV